MQICWTDFFPYLKLICVNKPENRRIMKTLLTLEWIQYHITKAVHKLKINYLANICSVLLSFPALIFSFYLMENQKLFFYMKPCDIKRLKHVWRLFMINWTKTNEINIAKPLKSFNERNVEIEVRWLISFIRCWRIYKLREIL